MNRTHLRNALVGLLITLVVWTFYRANARDPTEVTGLDRAVLRVSAPLERAFTVVFSAWVAVYKQWLYRIDLKEENRRLAAENAALAANNRLLAATAERSRELRAFRSYMEESAAEFLAANVVRRRIDSARFRVVGIVIDRVHGDVVCGAPVVTPAGVVGRILYFELGDGERLDCPVEEALKSRKIQRKYGGFPPRIGRAMVQLTVDPQSRLDVRIPRTGARGILRGTGWDRSYSTRIQYVGASPLITAGDLVVTSGVDGRFPPGLPVGRVIAVTDQPGQEPLVTVRPAVDFGKLKRVLVVLSPPPPESAARPRKPPDRLGLVPYP